jgi:cell wall-associated NlpC family hydrolase
LLIFAHVVKNFFYIIVTLVLLTSCTATRKSYPGSTAAPPPKQLPRDPKFLENISIKPEQENQSTVQHTTVATHSGNVPGMAYSTDIEKCNALQFKYSILMEEPVETVTNERLISFLESWYGTPYKFGGVDRIGIDCSAFCSMLMDSVYGVALPRTARSQYEMGVKIKKDQLEQGDLVFFNTTGGISHVGVFLANNKFVHAATSAGVMISDLNDMYYKKRFIGASRVR